MSYKAKHIEDVIVQLDIIRSECNEPDCPCVVRTLSSAIDLLEEMLDREQKATLDEANQEPTGFALVGEWLAVLFKGEITMHRQQTQWHPWLHAGAYDSLIASMYNAMDTGALENQLRKFRKVGVDEACPELRTITRILYDRRTNEAC